MDTVKDLFQHASLNDGATLQMVMTYK